MLSGFYSGFRIHFIYDHLDQAFLLFTWIETLVRFLQWFAASTLYKVRRTWQRQCSHVTWARVTTASAYEHEGACTAHPERASTLPTHSRATYPPLA